MMSVFDTNAQDGPLSRPKICTIQNVEAILNLNHFLFCHPCANMLLAYA